MLGKLIKHEWKAVWKFLTVINVFLVCLTIIGSISISYMASTDSIPEIMQIFLGFGLLFYVISIFIVAFVTLIYLAMRYYKNMYSAEGYLTHTLPATPLQHIAAKGIVAMIWTAIAALNTIFSVLVLVGTGINSSTKNFWSGFGSGIKAFFAAIEEYSNMSAFVFCLLILLFFVVTIIYNIATIYGSISIGQLFHKHRMMSSFAVYFGLTMLLQIFASIFSSVLLLQTSVHQSQTITIANGMYTTVVTPGMVTPILTNSFWISIAFFTVSSVILLFVSNNLTKKKLNLE